MARPLPPLTLTAELQEILQTLTRRREAPHSLVQCAQIVLAANSGCHNKTSSLNWRLCEDTVGLWRKRWVDNSIELKKFEDKPKQVREAVSQWLADKPRPGSSGVFTAEQICQLLAVACQTPPELARTVIERGIVEQISASRVGRFLKSGGFNRIELDTG